MNLNEGDQVYLKSNHKFNNQFLGPFTIVKKINSVNFEVQWLTITKHP